MKKFLTCIFIVPLLVGLAKAQTWSETTSGTRTRTTAQGTTTTSFKTRISGDTTTVVKDSTGVRIPYKVWHEKILSGGYMLHTMSMPADTGREYTLVKMTNRDLERMRLLGPPPDESGMIRTGEKLNLFKIRDIDGMTINPKDLAGKVVVLNFWFIACAPCMAEMPELNKIRMSFAADTNVVFIAIATDKQDALRDFLKDHPFTYRVVANGKNYASLYGIKAFPTNIVLDKQGRVVFHAPGYGPIYPVWIKEAITKASQSD
ncbi:MAG TPA: TlpA disulfide reductase family protein [Mucilaginibacter sp.]|nr:TlpA disulfide reductase family protein [Mucilaginibacter sp.]